MRKRIKCALIVGVTLLIAWLPVAWLAELGHDPISGERSFHPVGSLFLAIKTVLEFPLSWSGPGHPVNSPAFAFGLFLAFWTTAIMLSIEGIVAIGTLNNKKLPNQTNGH